MKGSESDGVVLLTFFSSITPILRPFLSLMYCNQNFFFFFSFTEPASTYSPCKTATRSPVRYCSNFTANFLFYGFFSENSSCYSPKNRNFPLKNKKLLSCKSQFALVLGLSLFLISTIVFTS